MVRLGLKTLGWKKTRAALAAGARRASMPVQFENWDAAVAKRIGRLVAAAASLAGGTCLARSIVLTHLLERRGLPAALRIGVRKGEQGFEAHSWVEVAGTVLNEGREVGERYAAFDRDFAFARIDGR